MVAELRLDFGVSVTVFKSAEKLILAGTTLLLGSRSTNELFTSNVAGSIALLKTTLTVVVTGTLVAPLIGVVELTVGGTRSVPVPAVNDVAVNADWVFPLMSLTPATLIV